MEINDNVLEKGERISLSLRSLYRSYGYGAYKMSKFEEYDLYAKNKEFLVSDNVITFTDMSGKLMALKPDVTLSIIKNSKNSPDEIKKVYYSENVYRIAKDAESYKEIMQTGLECFGAIKEEDILEVIVLAAKSLKTISSDCALAVSDISVITEIVSELVENSEQRDAVLRAAETKNIKEIEKLLNGCADKKRAAAFIKLLKIGGGIKTVIGKLSEVNETLESGALSGFINAIESLIDSDIGEIFYVDFSVIGDVNYYNGIVFRGFIKGVPSAVLSGGQYDNLMKKIGKAAKAIGFAVYVDMLERVEKGTEEIGKDEYINVALPKGRLGERVYSIFEKAGYECPSVKNPNRKLVFINEEKKVRYFWVKPSDVSIYVERGAADVGVCGKDIIVEYEPDVYELLDLKEGNCKMAVAAANGFSDSEKETLRVATKFANVAKKFYRSRGRNIDIIHLNGSIEIAPLLNLSDVIVDIVETGATLKENNLSVIETVFPVSARLIANKAAYKFKGEKINKLTENIAASIEGNL